MTIPFDYKYVKRPMPSILDEIFTEAVRNLTTPTTLQGYNNQLQFTKTTALQESDDLLNVALEIPRLERSSISVSVQKQNKRISEYDLIVEAGEILLDAYLSDCETKALKTYKKVFRIETSRPVDLDGALSLSYSEGVLVVDVPLTKPTEAKKQGLSARLADIEN